MSNVPVFTIGYGNRSFTEVARILRQHGIQYLIDVRSSPYSRFNQDFTRERLDVLLKESGIRYVFMGDRLGGRPADPDCYKEGKVDYRVVADKYFFHEGIDRIRTAWEKGLHVALMCSEGKPQECHRSKLIGRTLVEEGIEVVHLDETGTLKSQEDIVALLAPQHALFDVDASYTSRKQYSVPKRVREAPRWPEVVTVGVYGFDEEEFFATLSKEGVDTFCDLRMRRGMRGRTYAFVNSERLQERLNGLGIRYVHRKELAPTQEVRDRQVQADREAGEAKRERTVLSPAFIQAYSSCCLSEFDSAAFLKELGQTTQKVALFCVEREPEACHRSLVAERLVHDLGIHVEHLKPCELSLLPRR